MTSLTEITPYHVVDNPNLIRVLADWVPDAAPRKTILVDTPLRLYRF